MCTCAHTVYDITRRRIAFAKPFGSVARPIGDVDHSVCFCAVCCALRFASAFAAHSYFSAYLSFGNKG